MPIQRLSHDIQEDTWLWANVCRFSTSFHAEIKRSLSCPQAKIIKKVWDGALRFPLSARRSRPMEQNG